MATAPFQAWLDLTTIASAVRASGTVTVTTAAPHGITTGAYIQMAGATGVSGTSMNGVFQITATSGSTFTYTSAGTAGTGTTGSACISYDLLNPLINYSGSAKDSALYVTTESLVFAASGDGSGASSSIQIMQDDVPSDGPWYTLVPDQTRIRIVKANTGTTPEADGSDVYFTSAISSVAAGLNGSGQGVISTVQMQDVTSLLEKVFVYSLGQQRRLIAIDGLVRSGGTVTVTTNLSHGLTNGGTVTIGTANGGGIAEFNGTAIVVSNAVGNTFTYYQGGTATHPDAVGNANFAPTSITVSGSSFTYQMPSGSNLLVGGPVFISGITHTNATVQSLVNGAFESPSSLGADQLVINVGTAIPAGGTFTLTEAKVRTQAVMTPAGAIGNQTLTIGARSKTETEAVTTILNAVDKFKNGDPAFQRLFNTQGTAFIVGASGELNKDEISLDAQSIRGVLDEISGYFQGIDGKPRRYFVDPNGNLNYSLADAGNEPTYATAPYKLITTGTADPNTTSAAATLNPFNLEIAFNNQGTKAGIPLANAGTAYTPYAQTYEDYGFAKRKGAPLFEEEIPETSVTSAYKTNSYNAGLSFFLQPHQPLLTGVAVIRGAGTAAHNQYGFSAGYAQTGASTFALVKRWEPGQWMSVTCAELGLSGLYRIEQVDWTLERGSFTQIITLTFSFKPQSSLSSQLARVR